MNGKIHEIITENHISIVWTGKTIYDYGVLDADFMPGKDFWWIATNPSP